MYITALWYTTSYSNGRSNRALLEIVPYQKKSQSGPLAAKKYAKSMGFRRNYVRMIEFGTKIARIQHISDFYLFYLLLGWQIVPTRLLRPLEYISTYDRSNCNIRYTTLYSPIT